MHALALTLALLAQPDIPPAGLAYPAPTPEAATKADLKVLEAAVDARLRKVDRQLADLADQLRTMQVVDAIVPATRPAAKAAAPQLARRADARGQLWEHPDAAYLKSWVARRNASLAAPAPWWTTPRRFPLPDPSFATPAGSGCYVNQFGQQVCPR